MHTKFIATTSILTLAFVLAVAPATAAFAAKPEFGSLYNNGDPVRTVIPPSHTDKGFDDIYKGTNGAEADILSAVNG